MRYIFYTILLISLLNGAKYKYTNSLINSDSLYLQQHAHNPVNWYSWSEKTLQKAKKQNKLIFLSIGYSTCHWCHVMEEESFQNEKLAQILNKNYISIKVDKEIDSDIDIYYQDILSSFKTRRNGWPLNVILTPNLDLLYITTYIPPVYKYGTKGLDTILDKYVEIFHNKTKLKQLITLNKKNIAKKDIFIPKDDTNIEKQYIEAISKVYDDGFKGFFKRPRFPYSSNLNLLYDIYDLTKNKIAIKMVYEPLTAMANGGIYDQIDGGFFRYSTRQDWIIPHFEKMLYTTAELIPLYSRAYNDTKNRLYKKVVVESLAQIEQRFLDNGLFYSASDADSNTQEGGYFLYKYDTAFKALLKAGYNKVDAEYNLEYLDITSIGNFDEDLSNPHLNNNFPEDIKPIKLETTITILKNIRKNKQYPFIDQKVITSWNAMMIKGYLSARYIDNRYKIKGLLYLDKLLEQLYIDGTLYHFYRKGYKITQKALLEDYSFLIDTLLYAYRVTYNKFYLDLAIKLTNDTLGKFYKDGIWYLSDTKLNSKANFNDRYYTSALGKMFENLITVANFTYDIELLYKTKTMIEQYKNQILSDIPNHSSGIKAILRVHYGDIILKANKQNLEKYDKEIYNIKYPFLYTKYEDEKGFLCCDESTCFGYSLNFNTIKSLIKQHK